MIKNNKENNVDFSHNLLVYVKLSNSELNTLKAAYLENIEELETTHFLNKLQKYTTYNIRKIILFVALILVVIVVLSSTYVLITTIFPQANLGLSFLTDKIKWIAIVFTLMVMSTSLIIILDDKTYELYRELRKIELVLDERRKDEKTEIIFEAGDYYKIYKEIIEKLKNAKRNIFIIDAYADNTLFDLYLVEVPADINIKILTKFPKGNFTGLVKLFKEKIKRKINVKNSDDIHDRLLFIDDEGWVIGASIKDAGNKPTYIKKIEDTKKQYEIYSHLFDEGKDLIPT